MTVSRTSPPAPSATRPLSALLSQSNDDFYSNLQTVMNALPAQVTSLPVAAGVSTDDLQRSVTH